jgi:hypothetical protein
MQAPRGISPRGISPLVCSASSARLRLRGGSGWASGAEDDDGYGQEALEMALHDDALPLPSAALASHAYRRVNRTALDLAVHQGRGSALVAGRIDDALLLAQGGIDEEDVDRKVRRVLQEYEDVDFSGEPRLASRRFVPAAFLLEAHISTPCPRRSKSAARRATSSAAPQDRPRGGGYRATLGCRPTFAR